MKKTRLGNFILFGAVVALSAGIAAAGVGDLTYVKTVPPGVRAGGGVAMKKPADPAALGLTHANAMVVADSAAVKVAFDADDANADKLNVARIDLSGKGNFKDAVTVKLTKSGNSRGTYYLATFGPRVVEITKDGKKMSVLVSGMYSKNGPRESGSAGIQAVAEGQCKFGDVVRKVLVIDGNRNLKLGDVITIKRGTREYKSADYFRIADDKGQFDTKSRGSLVRMGNPIQVDGKWYELTCGEMKVAAKPVAGGSGKLAIDAPRWECMLSGNGYSLNVTGGTEPVDIPVGEYKILMFRLYRQADATKTGPNVYGRRTEPVTIVAGKETPLSLGTDITMTVSATLSEGKVQFSASLADAAGSRISTICGNDGKRPAPPQVEVVDKAGKVVYTATLGYG